MSCKKLSIVDFPLDMTKLDGKAVFKCTRCDTYYSVESGCDSRIRCPNCSHREYKVIKLSNNYKV